MEDKLKQRTKCMKALINMYGGNNMKVRWGKKRKEISSLTMILILIDVVILVSAYYVLRGY